MEFSIERPKDKIKMHEPNNPIKQFLPLKIVVAGDFSNAEDQNKNTGPSFTRVARNTLNSFLEQTKPNIRFEVDNKFSSDTRPLSIEIHIKSLRDFSPQSMMNNLDILSRIKTLHTIIKQFQNNEISEQRLLALLSDYQGMDKLAPILQQLVGEKAQKAARDTNVTNAASQQQKTTDKSGGNSDNVSRLLDMVDNETTPVQLPQTNNENDQDPSHAHQLLNTFINHIQADTKREKHKLNAGNSALEQIQHLVDIQVSAILHHPVFKKAEQLWRGLDFLLSRADNHSPIQIYCLDTTFAECTQNLNYFLVEHNETSHIPTTLVILTWPISKHADTMQTLQAISHICESMQTPAVFGLQADFIDFSSNKLTGVNTVSSSVFDNPRYIKWNALRDNESARWLMAVENAFLLREPYQASTVQAAGVTEFISDDHSYVWSNPAYGIGVLVMQSFARYNWPTEIQGSGKGVIEDLPLYEVAAEGASNYQYSLQKRYNVNAVETLADFGIASLAAEPNDVNARLYFAPCLYKTPKYSDEHTTHLMKRMNNLPYQLLLARIANTVNEYYGELRQLGDASAVQNRIQQVLQELLSDTGNNSAIDVRVNTHGNLPDKLVAAINLRTGHNILRNAEVEFGLSI